MKVQSSPPQCERREPCATCVARVPHQRQAVEAVFEIYSRIGMRCHENDGATPCAGFQRWQAGRRHGASS
jgi:hypothetical protein